MTTPPVQVERRVGQRFPYLLPLSLRQPAASLEGVGFTQDLSSRGVFFFTDSPLTEGTEIEITLRMPSEITLGESMRVRCPGTVLRVVQPSIGTKLGVAVHFASYEYLVEERVAENSDSSYSRISALHGHGHAAPEEPAAASPTTRRPAIS